MWLKEPGMAEPWPKSRKFPFLFRRGISNCNCFVVAAEADKKPLLKKPQCPGSVSLSAIFRPFAKGHWRDFLESARNNCVIISGC